MNFNNNVNLPVDALNNWLRQPNHRSVRSSSYGRDYIIVRYSEFPYQDFTIKGHSGCNIDEWDICLSRNYSAQSSVIRSWSSYQGPTWISLRLVGLDVCSCSITSINLNEYSRCVEYGGFSRKHPENYLKTIRKTQVIGKWNIREWRGRRKWRNRWTQTTS